MIQAKDDIYHDQFPIDMFLPLVVEVSECLHQQANMFFHHYANMAWRMKGT
jgi:hypothetical protein